jgi:hypothetical protein
MKGVSKIKLHGGVVGRVCTVLIVVAVAVAAMAWSIHNVWVTSISIFFIFILTFVMLWRVINFAEKNPQAALLEGAEFIRFEEIRLGTKLQPELPASETPPSLAHPADIAIDLTPLPDEKPRPRLKRRSPKED